MLVFTSEATTLAISQEVLSSTFLFPSNPLILPLLSSKLHTFSFFFIFFIFFKVTFLTILVTKIYSVSYVEYHQSLQLFTHPARISFLFFSLPRLFAKKKKKTKKIVKKWNVSRYCRRDLDGERKKKKKISASPRISSDTVHIGKNFLLRSSKWFETLGRSDWVTYLRCLP